MPVLRAPYFEREVLGAEMLDRLGEAVFAGRDAGAVLHGRVTQELSLHDGGAQLRLDLPFVSKGDVSLKKIGLELVVRVDGHKRTIMLPGAMAAHRPTSATLSDGSLLVGFTEQEAGPCLRIRSRPCARPSGWSARRPSAPSGSRARRRRAAIEAAGAPAARGRRRRRSRTCRRSPGLWSWRAARCRRTSSASSQQALRELLIALRAVLDYSIDRLEPGPEPPSATVEDIPIS